MFSIKERLESIGGQMSILPTPGCGTTITMNVPVPPEPLIRSPALSRKPEVREILLAEANRRTRILVADDHDLVRNGVAQLLSTDPTLEVVGEAANGREALNLARKLHPDVVVMDVRRPVMDGIAATRHITAELPGTVVVGISAFSEAGFKNEMLKAGAVDLLDKGEASNTLIATITRCLAERSIEKHV